MNFHEFYFCDLSSLLCNNLTILCNHKILLRIDLCMTSCMNIKVRMKYSQLKGRMEGVAAYNLSCVSEIFMLIVKYRRPTLDCKQ